MPSYGLGINAHDLTLPSKNPETGEHNLCRVRRISPDQLIALGILNNMDSLGALVKEAHLDRVAPKPATESAWQDPGPAGAGSAQESLLNEEQRKQLEFITRNAGRLQETMAAIDKVVELALIEPPIKRPVKVNVVRDDRGTARNDELPLAYDERDPNVLYTDMVDQDDKNAIMNFAISGVRALEPFREGRNGDVVDVPAGADVQLPAERVAVSGGSTGELLPEPLGVPVRNDVDERAGSS